MGRGVFWMPNAETVIIDSEAVYGDYDAANPQGYADIETEDDFPFRFRDFVEQLRSLLPPTYRPVATERWRGRESRVIAENRFFEVCVTDWECDFALSVAPRAGFATPDGFHPLAVANLHRAALAVWVRLTLYYALRVRTGAWTTAVYDPFAEHLAA